MKRCPICNEGVLQEKLVETWRRRGDRWVLLANVPALVCDVCGDTAFTQEIAEQLANILDLNNREFPTGFFWTPTYDLATIDLQRKKGERPLLATATSAEGLAQEPLFTPATPFSTTEETNTAIVYSAYPPKESGQG